MADISPELIDWTTLASRLPPFLTSNFTIFKLLLATAACNGVTPFKGSSTLTLPMSLSSNLNFSSSFNLKSKNY